MWQLLAHYGLVIEATNQAQQCIFKVPMDKHSLYNLSQVMDYCKNMPNIAHCQSSCVMAILLRY